MEHRLHNVYTAPEQIYREFIADSYKKRRKSTPEIEEMLSLSDKDIR